MNALNKINDPNLLELFSKQTVSTYYEGDGLIYLALINQELDNLLELIDGDVIMSIETGFLNSRLCDATTVEEFNDILLEKHNHKYLYEDIKLYAMKNEHQGLIHILTSIGIISIREKDIHSFSVHNHNSGINQHYTLSIRTFNRDLITFKFSFKDM